MQFSVPLLLFSLFFSAASVALDIRYVSDKQYIPVRRGAGNEFRIVHKGLPTGTRLTVSSTSSDGIWSEITTDGGTKGWIRSQYLMSAMPAQLKLAAMKEQAEKTGAESIDLATQVETLIVEREELHNKIVTSDTELEAVSQELTQLKQISSKAVQLDQDNRRLVEQMENLRSEREMLAAENHRLQEKIKSEDFMNGAMAVLLGVIIALVAPRLVPKRRKNSSWA